MRTCCFIGHRKIEELNTLTVQLHNEIETLIANGVSVFLFGSNSQFNDFCLAIVTRLKEKYPHISRVYVRSAFEYISKDYETYLLQDYEQTYFSSKARNAGRLSYVKRNQELIEKSDICCFYYDDNNLKSNGTKIAYDYAVKKHKTIINVYNTNKYIM